jgi:large subunit ribosomal protein L1
MGKTKTAFVSETSEPSSAKTSRGKESHSAAKASRDKGKPEKVHIAGLKGGQRIKAIDSETTLETVTDKETVEGKKQRVKKVRVRGKKWQGAKSKITPTKYFSTKEAIKLAKETSYSKFDGTLEAHILVKKVGIQANVALPNSTGKEKKIEVASEDTLKKLTSGKIDFDVLIATPEMMPKLVPFARILGPKGLMPNPKNGTLISDIKKAKSFSGNTINLKTEKEAPLIHTVFGKVSQKDEQLVQNLEAILKALGRTKQILKVYIKATMGPSVKIKVSAETA